MRTHCLLCLCVIDFVFNSLPCMCGWFVMASLQCDLKYLYSATPSLMCDVLPTAAQESGCWYPFIHLDVPMCVENVGHRSPSPVHVSVGNSLSQHCSTGYTFDTFHHTHRGLDLVHTHNFLSSTNNIYLGPLCCIGYLFAAPLQFTCISLSSDLHPPLIEKKGRYRGLVVT